MGFSTNTAQAPGTNQKDDSWKAQGFINLYLPAKDGKRRKLGSIPLKASKFNEKQLLDWLNEDPSRVATIKDKLIIEYQSAEQSPEHAFDLG